MPSPQNAYGKLETAEDQEYGRDDESDREDTEEDREELLLENLTDLVELEDDDLLLLKRLEDEEEDTPQQMVIPGGKYPGVVHW